MVFYEQDHSIGQIYTVGSDGGAEFNKMLITLNMVKPSNQDAWLVATNIGEFGHPLVRAYLG